MGSMAVTLGSYTDAIGILAALRAACGGNASRRVGRVSPRGLIGGSSGAVSGGVADFDGHLFAEGG